MQRLEKQNSHVNCLIPYMFRGLLFTTKDKKKDKVQVPQRNEMLFLYFTALGFISKKINLSKIPTTMRNVFK